MNEQELKEKLLDYGFYDEQGKYTVVLNKNFLKTILKCDNILLEETEHK